MVKREEKMPLPESAQRIAAAVKGLMAERGVTQRAMGAVIGGRAQSYVSERVSGVDAWNTLELELIARHLGFGDSFELLAEAQRRTSPTRLTSEGGA